MTDEHPHPSTSSSPGRDACVGDSGGPLLGRYRGAWRQLGVVAFGVQCGKQVS